MSAIITSRAPSFRGILGCFTLSKTNFSSCVSCGNTGGNSWTRAVSNRLSSSSTPDVFTVSRNGCISIRHFSSKMSAIAKLRASEILAEDVDNEERESKKRIGKRINANIPSTEEIMETDPAYRSPDYFQVHNLFTVRDLYDARVHLGHKMGSLNSRMNDFIYGTRFDCVIFDLDKTAFHLRQALNFAAHIAYKKGIILFITRSPHAMNLVENTAVECGEYAHCRDWHTHIMTNSENKFGGITRLPDLIIFFNTLDTVMATHKAVFDANKMLIPTIGIVDSNCDPNTITYPVPGNDDTLQSIQFYCKVFKEAILRGKQKRKVLDNKQLELQQESSS